MQQSTIFHSALCRIILFTLLFNMSLSVVAADDRAVRPGTIVYKINPEASPQDLKGLNALLKSNGLVEERTLEGSQIIIATFEHPGREKAVANILAHSGYVEFAEPDYQVEPIAQSNDPSLGNQWHHTNVNSRQAWDVTTGNNSVLVGVCDTGFDVNHPDLIANLRTDLAYNAHDGSTYIYDANGHGTGTAGTLGAVGNNGVGVAGMNWNVDIIPVRIAISDSNSSAYISTMARCIEYAADNGARVVNLSYGGIEYSTIDSAAKYLRSKNGLLFMSAGNDGQEFNYPDYTSFIGVGATDQSNSRASFSSWGNYVDLTAPGVRILTTYPDNRYVYYSGTSFSSPLTAGVAALMVAANPSITVNELENGLFSTTIDLGASGDDNVFGHGMVNAQAAVEYAANLGSTSPPVADIVASSNSVPFGTPVTLSGANSSDTDGAITSYAWNLGDGTTASTAEVTHTYGASGSFQVSLTVTDNDGLSDSKTTTIQVTNELPVAMISDMVTAYNVGETVFFSATDSFDNDGTIVSYQWNFGDGNSASGETAQHVFNQGGGYVVTLSVTDNAGATNSTSVEISVTDTSPNNPPTSSFTYSCTDLDCSFDGSGSGDNDGTITSYSWSFGDNTNGAGLSSNHTYGAAGSYTVTLTVTDDDGATDSSTQTVTVSGGAAELTLTATGSKVKKNKFVLLEWVNASGSIVEIHRKRKRSSEVITVPNTGTYEDSFSGGNYSYRVCEVGGSVCSEEVTPTF